MPQARTMHQPHAQAGMACAIEQPAGDDHCATVQGAGHFRQSAPTKCMTKVPAGLSWDKPYLGDTTLESPPRPGRDGSRDSAASRRRSLRNRAGWARSEEHTSELQSLTNLVCRLLLEK